MKIENWTKKHKVAHWICDCEEMYIYSYMEKGCPLCKASPPYRMGVYDTYEKIKMFSMREEYGCSINMICEMYSIKPRTVYKYLSEISSIKC